MWTEHVADNGVVTTDSLTAPSPGDVAQVAGNTNAPQAHRGTGSLFAAPVLVVNQRPKMFEVATQYSVSDGKGHLLANVNEVGQSSARKLFRAVSDFDALMTHRFEITDPGGALLLRLTRPTKLFLSTLVVTDPNGVELGRIEQRTMVGKPYFSLMAAGMEYGSIRTEDWKAWNFRIEDHTGREVARITKTFEGVLNALFTTADNYVVQVHEVLPHPLAVLVVAAAVSIDTALKQNRGVGD